MHCTRLSPHIYSTFSSSFVPEALNLTPIFSLWHATVRLDDVKVDAHSFSTDGSLDVDLTALPGSTYDLRQIGILWQEARAVLNSCGFASTTTRLCP